MPWSHHLRQADVHEAEGKRSTPQPLGSLHLHGVDGAVILVLHLPCVECIWLVTELMALQATAVAVGGQHSVVYDESSDDLDYCCHALHQSMAMLLPRAIKADSDGYWLVSREVSVQVHVHLANDGCTCPHHVFRRLDRHCQ